MGEIGVAENGVLGSCRDRVGRDRAPSRQLGLWIVGGWFALILGGCGTNEFAPFHGDPPQFDTPRDFDGLLGKPGDRSLAGWTVERDFYPPFVVLGRLRPGAVLTWSYDPTDSPLPEEVVRPVIRRVFSEWARAGGGFSVVEHPTGEPLVGESPITGNAIEIGWRRGAHEGCASFLGWDGGLAHATDPNWPGVGFVHLNAALTWTVDPASTTGNTPPGPRGLALRRPGKTQLETVLLHEIGHTLGLGHSCDPASIMSEVYSAFDPAAPEKPITGAARPAKITPSDAAGVQSLYGGGVTDPADLFICSVDAAGIPHPVAPALRRVALPGVVAWDVVDVDGDGCDEIITWPVGSRGAAVLGQGVCVYHFGAEALLERAEGPALGRVDPRQPLLLRDGRSRVLTGEIGHGSLGGDGAIGGEGARGEGRAVPMARQRFSSDGLPLKGVRPSDVDEADEVEGQWWVGGSLVPHPLRDLDGDGAVDLLVAGPPSEEGRRAFSFADRGEVGRVRFHARAAIPADLDGDGVYELVVQGLE